MTSYDIYIQILIQREKREAKKIFDANVLNLPFNINDFYIPLIGDVHDTHRLTQLMEQYKMRLTLTMNNMVNDAIKANLPKINLQPLE